MILDIFQVHDQAKGNFNDGEILENKPIGFPGDGGKLKPYSNIFYWAHAWTKSKKSTIGLHPHQGFEICSFVLKGSINHFDTKQNKWINLKKGDVQIIRSGNGISHSEEIMENSEIFQIWFDPDLSKALKNIASYNDYKAESFQIKNSNNKSVKIIKDGDSTFKMESEEITIKEHHFKYNLKKTSLGIIKEKVHSLFIITGKLEINSQKLDKGTFFKVHNTDELEIKILSDVILFEIISPINPSYKTYSNSMV
tara:strand:+ start:443 stop:1201 length:759 start_codon:yes stop_codon:yes gene_type:complete